MTQGTRAVSRGLMVAAVAAGLLAAPPPSDARGAGHHGRGRYFERIATLPVYLNTDVGVETVAEIVAATADGRTLVYTDSEQEKLGFVDIADPHAPVADGTVDLDGEPTSVAVKGPWALVAVNTSESFTNPSGVLQVVDVGTRAIVRTMELGGQPDSIAVSPNGQYAAIAIENERDEDAGDGRPPQSPPGFLVIVDLVGGPATWGTRSVPLVGLADKFPEDPEPEFVSINGENVAVVTLQENNHLVQVQLSTGEVIRDFPAGTVDLQRIDVLENELIEQVDSLAGVPREPDGVVWLSNRRFATADEGDLDGGSRGFTIFDASGAVVARAGSTVEHLVARLGHYPEERSENKGNEPEGVAFGRYGRDDLLFVGSERSSVVAVYRLSGHRGRPRLLQVLPTGVGPEGLLPIPQRGLFVVAAEVDDRGDKIRSGISIYQRTSRRPDYPTVYSKNRRGTKLPIPWGALSGLAVDPHRPFRGWTIHDSFYRHSRIFGLDLSCRPAKITREIVLRDCANLLPSSVQDEVDDLVNLDLEGVALRKGGGWWVVSEGAGSVDDESRPVTSPDLLIAVAWDGCIDEVIELPDATNQRQRRFGFEGVASVIHRHRPGGGHRGHRRGAHELVYVAFQREWVGDPKGLVRIGRYDTGSGEWAFYYYPLDAPTSPNGGWVGLSEIVALGGGRFGVIERDNQGATDARIKKLYTFSVAGLEPQPEGGSFPVVAKTLARDILPDLEALNGSVLEKIEGLAVLPRGTALIVNDNDGVDDSNGETQLMRIPGVF